MRMLLINIASHDLPLDVFEAGEKRPEKTKKAKSKAVKQAASTNGSATPNGANGGLTPTPRLSESTPTIADISSNLKRGLNPEVRQTLMAECTTIRGPLVDYRMLGNRNSSLTWQAIVISQLPTIPFHSTLS